MAYYIKGHPFEGPVKVEIEVRSRKSRADLSNVLKAIEDAMNKIVYNDDRQIQEIYIRRTKEDREEVFVTVSKIKGGEKK